MSAQRIGAARLRALEQRLSERDWQVLRALDDHRYLTTGQLTRLFFVSHATPLAGVRACVRGLDRLRHLRLIDRLARRIGGVDAGSRGFVWHLTPVGDRVLRHAEGEEAPLRRRAFEPSLIFLDHTLAVAEVRVVLEEAARSGALDLERVETEPRAWRRYTDGYGRPATLKPDLAAVTVLGDYEDHWFIEVDRGTESIRTLLAKCAAYEAYRQSGREQERIGVFPLVVWLIEDVRRRRRLESEVERARNLDPALYRVCPLTDFTGLVTGAAPPGHVAATPTARQLPRGGTT